MSMSDKLNFLLARRLPDEINWVYQILGHIKNSEIPIISPIWIKEVMAPTVFVASRVSKPHVIALVDKLDHRRKFFSDDPTVGRCKKSMLEENNLSIGLSMMSFHSENRLMMSISWLLLVALIVHTLFFYHLLEVFVIIVILAGFINIDARVDIVEKWRFSWIKIIEKALCKDSVL